MQNNLYQINNIIIVMFITAMFFMLDQRFFSTKSVPIDRFRGKMTKSVLIIALSFLLIRGFVKEDFNLELFLSTLLLLIGIYLLNKSLILSAEVEAGKKYYTASCGRKIKTSFWFLFIGIIFGILSG